ncbi:MAG TPA: signal recognition particle-docking protein FtsY [Acidimicrobiales bacterium]
MEIVVLVVAIAAVALAVWVTAGLVVTRRRERSIALEPPPGTEAAPRPAEAPAEEAPAAEAPEAAAEAPDAAVAAPEAPPAAPEAPPARPSFRDRLAKARGALSGYMSAIRSRKVDAETWDELEEALILADVGVTTTEKILGELRSVAEAEGITDPDQLLDRLKAQLKAELAAGDRSLRLEAAAVSPNGRGDGAVGEGAAGAEVSEGGEGAADAADGGATGHRPDVWLFVGVNGVGKTTTIGKIAHQQRAQGRSVVMAAGDTFRAAAAEQLGMWAERTGADIVRGSEGGDPSSVVYDAVQRAAARGHHLVLGDTAGRLHTKTNLMEELRKVRRVADRDPGNVTEVLLVLDATTGQNGLAQARQFAEAVDLTGVVLTKLDGSAKGGIALAIQKELGIPIKLVGLGETVDDLVEFDPDEFVEALFA